MIYGYAQVSTCWQNLDTRINLRVDDDVKKGAEQAFDDIGLCMTAAINVFLKKV